MSNTSYLKILFNTVFVVTLAVVTLNACQDSGSKKPVNKAKPGKNGLQKPSGTPSATQTSTPVKPKVEDVSGDDDQSFDPEQQFTDVTAAEKEQLTKVFEDLNRYFNETYYGSTNREGSKTIENYFGFMESQLKSSKLILHEVDFGSCSGATNPYLFKSKDKANAVVKFRFGIYDCGSRKHHDFIDDIKYDTQSKHFAFPLIYNQISFDKNMLAKFDVSLFNVIIGLDPKCELDWDQGSSSDTIKNLNCTDLGIAIGSGDSRKFRLFKSIKVEKAEKADDNNKGFEKIKFNFVDYSAVDVSQTPMKDTDRTAELIGKKIFLCDTKLLPGFDNCQEYKKLCDTDVSPKDAKCPGEKAEGASPAAAEVKKPEVNAAPAADDTKTDTPATNPNAEANNATVHGQISGVIEGANGAGEEIQQEIPAAPETDIVN